MDVDVDSDHVICVEIEATLRAKCEVLQRQLAELKNVMQPMVTACTELNELSGTLGVNDNDFRQEVYSIAALSRAALDRLASFRAAWPLPKRGPA